MVNRYKNIRQLEGLPPSYYSTKYPEIPLSENDIYVITEEGDRYDILADQYYGDTTLWWIISIANATSIGTNLPTSLPQNSMFPPIGTQIRIPANYSNIITSYNKLNSF